MLIVYQSYEGRFSDSPRAIHGLLAERMSADRHVWLSAAGHEETFPSDVDTVRWDTPESIDVLESADLIVANTHTDLAWTKRPDATYLQTWHGTPLKRIHRDVLWAPAGRLERLSRDVAQWDLLVSPNRVSTPLLRGAFRFDGEVMETGYPRNDVLVAPDRDAIRAEVREALGIPDGMRAVLYAPTWRDDVVFTGSDDVIRLHLDVERFLRELGDDHCLLLRLHYLLTGRLPAFSHPSVRDVSWHPDISALYLAADVLVTDYSSSMFDFAVTGKPMLFYTYDLAEYRDQTRGFYFDFVPEAPGPLLETTPALLEALRDLSGVVAASAERYAHFRDRYAHLEDGHATERVVERTLAAVGAGAT